VTIKKSNGCRCILATNNCMINYPHQLCRDLFELRRNIKRIGWKQSLHLVLQTSTNPSWQLTKYLIIGALSVVVFYASYGLFRIVAESLNPGVFVTRRLPSNLLAICFAFIPTNFFTYYANRTWVFIDGRYVRRVEFILFTTGAILSLVLCQILAAALISLTPINDFLVTLSVIAASTLANFLFRKFYVFRG